MRLVDQWAAIEAGLPPGWREVRLRLTTEQPGELARAAQVLAPMTAGRSGDALVFTVRVAGGASGPEAARRLFARLDHDRVWSELTVDEVSSEAPEPSPAPAEETSTAAAAQWDAALATLPADWSDLLCAIQLASSDLLPRAALLCAPLNPTRDGAHVGFVFRCARTAGYGASPEVVRGCLERLDEEGIAARIEIRRVLSDTRLVATQGPVWLVDGKIL